MNLSKIAVVTCSNAGIDYMEHNYDIKILRSLLLLNEESYRDFIDIKADQFYERLSMDGSIMPSTTMPSTGEMIETFNSLGKEGYEEVLFVTISSKLSGIYNNGLLAASMTEGIKVTVFDSLTVSYPQAKMVLTACELAEEGKTMEQVIQRLSYIRDNDYILFAVDTLRYLVKNGRLSNASGLIGSMLKIKPLLEIGDDGAVVSVEKIRTTNKALTRVVEKFIEMTEGLDVEPFICHANNYAAIEFFKEELDVHGRSYKDIIAVPLTPVVGAHGGPGAICLGFIKK